eukprot:3698033-Alexandrium_andersonii.AAC.1
MPPAASANDGPALDAFLANISPALADEAHSVRGLFIACGCEPQETKRNIVKLRGPPPATRALASASTGRSSLTSRPAPPSTSRRASMERPTTSCKGGPATLQGPLEAGNSVARHREAPVHLVAPADDHVPRPHAGRI